MKHLYNITNGDTLNATTISVLKKRERGSNGASRGRDTYAGLDRDAQIR
jgi:hypothetical protein